MHSILRFLQIVHIWILSWSVSFGWKRDKISFFLLRLNSFALREQKLLSQWIFSFLKFLSYTREIFFVMIIQILKDAETEIVYCLLGQFYKRLLFRYMSSQYTIVWLFNIRCKLNKIIYCTNESQCTHVNVYVH